MPTQIIEVINPKGMHARAASKIVAIINKYSCKVTLYHKQLSAPGDSLLKLLTLNAPLGSQIKVEAVGLDAEKLIDELKTLFAEGFGE